MKISIEKLVEIIIREIIIELPKLGVEIDFDTPKDYTGNSKEKIKEIDMSNYKTPVLTENQLLAIGKEIREIVIPEGTIITPVANEIIKKRNLIINRKKIGG
jgi:hypothetical protein